MSASWKMIPGTRHDMSVIVHISLKFCCKEVLFCGPKYLPSMPSDTQWSRTNTTEKLIAVKSLVSLWDEDHPYFLESWPISGAMAPARKETQGSKGSQTCIMYGAETGPTRTDRDVQVAQHNKSNSIYVWIKICKNSFPGQLQSSRFAAYLCCSFLWSTPTNTFLITGQHAELNISLCHEADMRGLGLWQLLPGAVQDGG